MYVFLVVLYRVQLSAEFASLRLSDFTVIATLGIGGFGRVELVSQVVSFEIEYWRKTVTLQVFCLVAGTNEQGPQQSLCTEDTEEVTHSRD